MIKFLVLFVFSFSVLAKDVTYIDKGTEAPYDGFLFTIEKTNSVRQELIEKDQLKIFNKALLENEVRHRQIISNNNTQIHLLINQNTNLMKEVEKKRGFERVLYFGLGVAFTGLAVYGASKLVK